MYVHCNLIEMLFFGSNIYLNQIEYLFNDYIWLANTSTTSHYASYRKASILFAHNFHIQYDWTNYYSLTVGQ